MNPIYQLLTENTGSSFANITTVTDPTRPSKKVAQMILDLGHKAIRKIGSRNVSIGNSYQTAVKNRLEKTGNDPSSFEVDKKSRDWSERINEGLIRHKESGQVYVEYYYLNSNQSSYTYIWENGKELTEEELKFAKENLFKSVSVSRKQIDAGLTEEELVLVNTVKIENVLTLKAFGKVATQELIIQ